MPSTSTELPDRLPNRDMLHAPDFRRLWFSNALSNFGAQITMLALPICAALLLHATPAQMGVLTALETSPFMLFGLPAGVLLDRSRRLPIMLCSDALVGLLLACVPLAWWLGVLSMPWLYAAGFAIGTGYVLGGGAEQVYLTFLVGREGLVDAQARFASTESAARLLGPGIAGVLVQLAGAPLAVLCNAAGFAISVFNLTRIRAREPRPEPKHTHPVREMVDGLAYVWRHALLRKLGLVAAGWHLLFFAFMALNVLFATRVLGMAPGVMGVAQMLGGAGVLAASMAVKPLSKRFGTGWAIVSGLLASAIGLVLLPLIPAQLPGGASTAAFAVATFWIDCGATLYFIPYGALRQRITPDHMLGRMVATMRFISVAMAPVGAVCAGALAEVVGVRASLACVGAGAVLLTLAGVLVARLHALQE
jgi:MFS family permease